ncbi:nitrilase-related carbon-nitrogen hydrolase [Marinifilum caeruleilacunae]|uniref:CN hydrolase domain-containing protein n=1 Tax=Marinifilum caeruleilacunae TaxID=2499076 RepID=A0ABX1WZ37_9BACT|nr:nitrilase-related carbon-nitrogen hydrolase [Marinifilum caeruleilacunae]NOU61390.1 hypothetical protein [Marinifilum caeruleilacunae]
MKKLILPILLTICVIAISCQQKEKQNSIPKMVNSDGSYETVPLEKDTLVLKLIQNSVRNVKKIENAKEVVNENLQKVKNLVVEACTTGDKPNIVLMHEFPLTGYLYGGRKDKVQMALQIPGEETSELCALAKQYDTYIIFGSYAIDPEWPDHILSLTTVIGRDGEILKKIWKPRNIKRFYSSFEITTTTVESVREKFIEKYGIEEELPVLRTEYGNIALSTVQLDPFIFSAFTMKGAEIILRTSTLFFESDIIYTAMANNVYSAMANIPADSPYGGNSMVVAPSGKVMARLDKTTEGVLEAKIPIAKFRENRKLPQYAIELTKDIFKQYQEEIPANHLDMPKEKLPQNGKEMKVLLDSLSTWLNQ